MLLKVKRVTSLMLIFAMALFVVGCGAKPIASVNGTKISEEDFKHRMDKLKKMWKDQGVSFDGAEGKTQLEQLEKQVLDSMIREEVIKQEADKQGIKVTDKEIEDRIQVTIQRFNNDKAQMEEALKAQGLNIDDLKRMYRTEGLKEQLVKKVAKDITVSDDEVKAYYNENKGNFKQLKAKHVLVGIGDYSNPKGRNDEEALKLAKEALAKLDKGVDFAEVAKEYSDDPGSKGHGGNLRGPNGEDFFGAGVMVPEFEQAAFGLKEGEYTKEPVKTSFGYHIISVEKIKDQKFEEVKEELKTGLLGEKQNAKGEEYIDKLISAAKIERRAK